MLKCKQFIEKVSEMEDIKVSNQWNTMLHYALCIHCRNYVKQLGILKLSIKDYFNKQERKIDLAEIQKIEDAVIKEMIKK